MSRSWGHRSRAWHAPSDHHRRTLAAGVALGLTLTAGTTLASEPTQPEELRDGPPRGTYIKVPDAQIVDPVGPQAGGAPPHILYIQRCLGGLELMPGPDSSIDNTSSIPPGPVTLPEYPFGNDSWEQVMVNTRDIFSPFNIQVTDEDPGTIPHDEAVVCGDAADIGIPGAGGVAPFNCGIIPNAVTFTFPESLGDSPRLIAEVIAQEAAHAWGLDHELLCEDPMTYLSGCGNKYYQDVDAECGEFDPRPCDCGVELQNSYQHILGAFGPAIPDVEGPIITITAPLTGTMYEQGDGFTVLAEIVDDSIVEEAALYNNGELVEIDTTDPWGWQINNAQGGLYTLEIVAVDEYGNEGLSIPVSILVAGGDPLGATGGVDESGTGGPIGGTMGGSGGMTMGGTDSAGIVPGNPGGCGCNEGDAPAPAWALGLWVLALVRRRRR